jgi:hypothetical protein
MGVPMKTIYCLSLSVGLVLGVTGLRAQSPTANPVKGRVLVLENGRTVTGDIEQDGDRYRIKRLTGETSVPVTGVLRLCGSLEEALDYLRSRTNLLDPDERLKLANWCGHHSLRDQQIAEVEAAMKMRPEDARIARLHRGLIESKRRAEAPAPPPTPEPTYPRVEVGLETLSTFVSKVQPIMMNACSKCHNPGRNSSFQLRHPNAPGLTDRRAIDANLAALAGLVDVNRPLASQLLTKAVTIHAPGMIAPPLNAKTHATAIKTLENWVNHLVATSPSLRPSPAASALANSGNSPPAGVFATNPAATAVAPMPVASAPVPPAPPTAFGEARPMAKPKEIEDPLGPEEFNREAYPMGKTDANALPSGTALREKP